MSLLLGLFLLVVSLRLLFWLFQTWKLNKTLHWLSGPPSLPLLGNLQLVGKKNEDLIPILSEWHETYGDTYLYWIGPSPVIVSQDADFIKALSKFGKEVIKSCEYDYLAEYLGRGLITSTGEKWNFRRKLLTSTFHQNILDDFSEVMKVHAQKFIDYLEQFSIKGETFDFLHYAKLNTLTVVTETLLGVNLDAIENPCSPYVQAIDSMTKMIIMRSFHPIYRIDFFFNISHHRKTLLKDKKVINDFVRGVITKREEERKLLSSTENPLHKNTGKKRKALLDLLLDLKDGGADLTNEDIEEEVNNFAFAGHDTTSVALSYLIYLLGSHQEIQEKLFTEINEKIPNMLEDGLLQKINSLDYLDRCTKESLRCFPPVPVIGKIFDDPLTIGENIIPKGVSLVENLYGLHLNEKYYKNATEFNPDRFLSEEERHNYSYIPFSAGPRNCIGYRFALMELKLTTIYILKKYKIEAFDPLEELNLCLNVVLSPKKGINVKFHLRDAES